jgi:YD repeat-containing protein
VNHYDELGRGVRTESQDDSGALNIATDHVYQAVKGDLASYEAVSNPYCMAAGPQCDNTGVQGWRRTRRDANNRVVEVASFDGAGEPGPWGTNGAGAGATTTSYDAERSTLTDAGGKQRTNTQDALGRLGSVVEDPAGSPGTTTYVYDAADRLTEVQQNGRNRYFGYDTLGRLAVATNPERRTVT